MQASDKFDLCLNKYILLSCFFFIFSISAFFPILSYFLSVSLLFLFNRHFNHRFLRLLFVFNALFSIIAIYLSRDFISELEHDLSLYYFEYTKMVVGSWESYRLFSEGLEPGYHILYTVIAAIFPGIDEIGLALANLVITLILFVLWIEFYLLRDKVFLNDAGLIYALIIMFIGFVTFGYLQRQSLSIVFLLYSLTARHKYSFFIFSILSVCFHLTSLPLIVIYKLMKKIDINQTVLIIIIPIVVVPMILLKIYFYSFVDFIVAQGFEFPGVQKLNFYMNKEFGILSLKDLILNLFLFVFLVFNWNNVDRRWKNIVFFSLLVYFSFLGIPLLSERVSFILFFLYGFFVYIVIFQKTKERFFYKFLFLFYLCFFCFKNISMVSVSGYEYWVRHSYFNYVPFYYFIGHET